LEISRVVSILVVNAVLRFPHASVDQMKAGFERVARGIDELIKDIPKADKNFVHFVKTAQSEGYLPQAIVDGILAIETVAKAAA
jgi:hypothetical protein